MFQRLDPTPSYYVLASLLPALVTHVIPKPLDLTNSKIDLRNIALAWQSSQ